MKLPNFQRKRLTKTYEPGSYVLVYDTGAPDEVEVLETEINGVHYPLTFKTFAVAVNNLKDYNLDRFLNLRPAYADDLLR